ncbi:aminotransferase class I/II-fold pyridoxal phosphate-dependent enzyme [Tardiphaga alba]|uniref:Aminotransferase class I/II-fold pyridoxal phosphate-dependent enzyme n=1 Tax=Tardiphaga alba TaxID=340268 RepID=A0ABX8ABF0_9BRAD|nr:aminotransferase class I/II-fold pyridoxal phosphate-dependent enzyme [Tardiphaga alba]QUS39125.1 aminotransferase class I/II-fold pyridoxal phosphate-dependent enzyme [Tardiphaga alba]
MTPLSRIPLAIPDLRGREAELLVKCVTDNWVSSAGPEVTAFEAGIAALTGRCHAIAVVNGTAALHLALLASEIKPGDRVVVPDWTFAASANAVAHAGATPIFVDVTEVDWALDPILLSKALAADRTIRAVIAVDPVGHAADLDSIHSICRQYDVVLVEDAAGAIGGTYKGKPCGALGDVSAFSFNGNKTLTAGGGGMVLTDDAHIAQIVRHRSTQARPGADYIHDAVGYNYRMTNLNAAVGLAQLERLGEMVSAKRAIAARYDAAFAGRTDIKPMPRPDHSESSCWLYSVRVEHEDAARTLVRTLQEHNAEARIFWRSLSQQAPWQGAPRYLNGVAEALSGTVVSLPCSSSLSENDQDRVIAAIDVWRDSGMAAA